MEVVEACDGCMRKVNWRTPGEKRRQKLCRIFGDIALAARTRSFAFFRRGIFCTNEFSARRQPVRTFCQARDRFVRIQHLAIIIDSKRNQIRFRDV